MNPPVFISYARHTSIGLARKLEESLGSSEAFLDESDLEAGSVFTRGLVEALLNSRVVVVFADETYFRRWYCLRELRTALAPFLALGAEASEEEKEAELRPIVIVRPPEEGSPEEELKRLPSLLRNTQWRKGDDLPGLVHLVRTRVAETPATLGERLERRRGGARAELCKRLMEELTLPPPRSLAGFRPLYPVQWPPSLDEGFKGRADELWQLDFHLSTLHHDEASGAASTVALVAGGGMGKTRLALEYVYRLGPRHYPGGIFWVDAGVETDDAVEKQLHGILRALRREVPDLVAFRKQERNAAAELAEALHEAARGSVLYVVDNIPEAPEGAVPRPLDTWCPAVGKVALLVTSRAPQGVEGIQSLHVGTLSPESSVQLLTEGVDESSWEEPTWSRIAEWVGCLPLALAVLNRALRYGGVSREELLELAQHRGPVRELDRQVEALRGQIPSESLRGVTEALLISYERLPEAARKTARYLAQLAPEPVPLALLEALCPKDVSHMVRFALVTRNFVTKVRGVKKEQVPLLGGMHRVLADLVLEQSPDWHRERSEVCAALLWVMTAEARLEPQAWALVSACLPHAERLFEELGRGEGPLTREDELHLVRLGVRIGKVSNDRGLLKRASEVAALTLEWAQATLEADHPDTLKAQNIVALTLWTEGKYKEAREFLERVWHGRYRVLGAEHRYTLKAVGNLAFTFWLQDHYTQAHSLQTHVLEVSRRVLGEEHPDTLRAMNALANTLSALGDYPGARQLHTQVLEVRRRVLGEEHPDTLSAMNNLTNTLSALGYSGARQLRTQVLEVRRRVLGEEHPDTLSAMDNLANTLSALGDYPGARQLRTQVLEVRRRVLGEEHPRTLASMNNLAITLSDMGDDLGARQLHTQVLEVRRRVLGEEHPHTLRAMNALALTLYALGDYLGARQLQTRVLEVHLRALGEEHPHTLRAMNALALTLSALGDYLGARQLQTRVLEVHLRALGEEHPHTIRAARNLAATVAALRHAAKEQPPT
ncbi:tetratricopeptide repeat protein [Archangium violaceum]|uniref:tetratricopeptide repeat protein n=1 Tax=Archangium violaceum TaxID=83451 RepID=UPI0036DEC621